ncbi:MAG: hypothetical protein HDR51_08565 [Treponema sp.]|nr:hypothetical protein [Treponema sp.]
MAMNIKRTVFVILLFALECLLFAQTNTTVDVNDEIYDILSNAESRGLCTTLSEVRPYTEKYILKKLDEILGNLPYEEAEESSVLEMNEDTNIAENGEMLSEDTVADANAGDEGSESSDENTEKSMEKKTVKRTYKDAAEYQLILREKERFVHKKGFDVRHLSYRIEGGKEKFPLSFEVGDSIVGLVSGGVYSKADSSVGYELFDNVNFYGDFGKNISYYASAYFGITLMPLQEMGTYNVGYWWYDDDESEKYDTSSPDYATAKRTRTVKTFRNRSVIPYTYSKYWDGNVFYFSDMTATGTEGWPVVNSMGFGMFGEIHASFLDNKIEIGAARLRREWAAMDDGASLVLNASARPFFGVDLSVRPFKFLSLSALTGILEAPNQDYINSTALKGEEDFYYFQNAFTLVELDFDFKYVHFDFGSSVVWPKRLDLGYMFPLIDRVMYQDNLGDFDNLALFANVKVRYPGLGCIWISGYVDEIGAANPIKVFKNMFNMDRYMFAFQLGMNANIPFIPFGTLSFRYTKVEPYCYTHQAINYTPWYSDYIIESYTNNGESLGYYLPPNSDEIHIKFKMRPSAWSMAALQYQLVRHGADYGSRQVDGSSLYSELPRKGRDNLKKYFLRDGAYEWTHIVSLGASYDFKQFKVPIVLNCSLGFVYSSFTDTDSALGVKGDYHKIDTDEYSAVTGFVATLGFTIFGR